MIRIEHEGAQELMQSLRAPFAFMRRPPFKWAAARFLVDLAALWDRYAADFDAQVYKPKRKGRGINALRCLWRG